MPRPGLSCDRIVSAAIQIADEQGLDAVTLRGIAKRLQVHVTSLYNHIPTKEELFVEMSTALMAEADLPVGEITWQDWIRVFASEILVLARRHPGAFQLLQQGPAQGEGVMQSLESAIAAFQADGFDTVSTDCAITTVSVAVLGMVLDDLRSDLKPEVEKHLSQLPRDRFPHIHRLLAVSGEADSFGFLVEVLVAGIAANRNNGRLCR
ncbi:TetR/AcrR family transcriptional regulator [Kineobactrum salinum]|uniref:TetR/AcrR family transcriptional regulator n=1 Tax=Kineobactrum salinum TaxID=2708301 RepID=A0A6C0U8P1_9GAMM|nr:TetR/AcrR family transcriptional regulator [Kineobactrum salinum]QIB66905.1 TetR/AcrR family transcriptional regulator [Kineobactrum salinum]